MHKFVIELWADESAVVELDSLPTITLNGETLDPRIAAWAIDYGFRQGIRDAAAAEKDDAARNAKAAKRIEALIANTLREGGGGGPKLTPVDREMRALAEAKVRAAAVSQGLQIPAKKVAELAKKLLERDEKSLRAEAEANLAKRAETDGGLDLSSLMADDEAA